MFMVERHAKENNNCRSLKKDIISEADMQQCVRRTKDNYYVQVSAEL
jgi:thioredoxin-related protein